MHKQHDLYLRSQLHSLVSYISFSDDGSIELDFFKGSLLEVPQKVNLHIEVESLHTPLPDYFEVHGVPVVNKKFIEAIELASVDNYQAFPVEIRFEDVIKSGYFILNVIGQIKCFDEPRSKLSKFGPSIALIFSLKLLENPANGSYIFRAHEYLEVIFIQENVKKEIEKANISGCKMRNADGWSDEHRF